MKSRKRKQPVEPVESKEPRVALAETAEDRYRAFARHYWETMNVTQAAVRAGYSPRSAHAQGSALLKNPRVRELVEAYRAEVRAEFADLQERVIAEYIRIAFADPAKAAEWGAGGLTMIDSKKLGAATRAAIAEVKETRGRDGTPTLSFKMHDKKGALDQIAKLLGMVVDRHTIAGDPSNASPIRTQAVPGMSDALAEQIRVKVFGLQPKEEPAKPEESSATPEPSKPEDPK